MAAIFPIIRRSELTNQEEICGTGFLISRIGHFLTAHHIIEGFVKDKYFAGLDPSNLVEQTPISIVSAQSTTEILFGKIEPRGDAPLQFADKLPDVGSSIQLKGYPGRNVLKIPAGLYLYREIRLRHFTCKYIEHVGHVPIPSFERDGKKFTAKRFPAITSDGAAEPGFSGGPVTDAAGRLIGLHSMVVQKCGDYNGGNPFMLHVSLDALCKLVCGAAPEIAEMVVPSRLRTR